MIVTAFRKKFQIFFYFISKPHFSNPFTTYMAFLSPNVTAILKFLEIFQLLFSIQTVVFPTITKKLLLQIHFYNKRFSLILFTIFQFSGQQEI